VVEVEGGDHEHARPVAGCAVAGDRAGGLDPVGTRHPDVHQDDVGREFACHRDGRVTVGGFCHDFDVGLGFQDHLDAAAYQRLVIGDHDADHAVIPPREGSAGSSARSTASTAHSAPSPRSGCC
jgi:hypothetical protein